MHGVANWKARAAAEHRAPTTRRDPNTFVEVIHVTLTPQEPIPGISCSSVAFMTRHVEVPLMATIWPGSTARAAARSRGH
jgi:hypothetical protein